jgi:Ferredoxin-dependent bilin reductase
MDLWNQYKKVLFDTFSDLECSETWAEWTGNGMDLTAKTYTSPHILKSREVEIWNEKSCIYNNIIYPKTGSNLPCFGMDLMGFFDKKVILVFDFQHPEPNYKYDNPFLSCHIADLRDNTSRDIRFFEAGNHFSDYIYVRNCTMSEVNDHLENFTRYLTAYKDMVECSCPNGTDTSVYREFDQYMKNLDPVGGYLANKFGKDRSESLVNDFLFCYG